jgi:hypothetical protein
MPCALSCSSCGLARPPRASALRQAPASSTAMHCAHACSRSMTPACRARSRRATRRNSWSSTSATPRTYRVRTARRSGSTPQHARSPCARQAAQEAPGRAMPRRPACVESMTSVSPQLARTQAEQTGSPPRLPVFIASQPRTCRPGGRSAERRRWTMGRGPFGAFHRRHVSERLADEAPSLAAIDVVVEGSDWHRGHGPREREHP